MNSLLKLSLLLVTCAVFIVMPYLGTPCMAAESGSGTPDAIHLRTRAIPVSSGIESSLAAALEKSRDENIHVLVQFKDKLTFENHRELATLGIKLQSFLGGNAYVAAIPPGVRLDEASVRKVLQWAGRVDSGDKLSRELAVGDYNEWTLDERSGQLKVLVQHYSDVDERLLQRKLQSLGLKAERYGPSTFALTVDKENLRRLAGVEEVKFVQEGPMPPLYLNERGRRLTRTDHAQWAELDTPRPTYRGASGIGVRIGICDSGVDQDHEDFFTVNANGTAGASRVYNQRPGDHFHGTHVASIAGGNGFNSASNGWPAFSLRGHAPRCELGDYPNFGSDVNDFHDAIVNDGTDVTNHSYVQSMTVYDAEAADLESIVRGDAVDSNGNAIPARPQVWAAGNNGISEQYGNEDGYYAVFTSAKNTISVGSLDTFDYRLSDFSSMGPTFDGRIKPDVVAPGCLDSIGSIGEIQAADDDTQGYRDECGTSMAAPAVSGIIGLMMNTYEETFGVFPNLNPSLYKAILVQSAQDQIKTASFDAREFNNPDTGNPVLFHAGPDFATGYGLVDAAGAVAIIEDSDLWRQSTINSTGVSQTWCVYVPEGADQFKVTLAWDDEPGDTSTAETAAKLVNDLDLELIAPDGSKVLPWTLNQLPLTANPGDGASDPITQADVDPAFRGTDRRNNVEMATMCKPQQGTWKIRVTGFNLPTGNSQPYSMVSSHPVNMFCFIPPPDICDLIPELCPPFDICDRIPWICEGLVEIPDIIIRDWEWIVDPQLPQPIDEICKYVINCPGCDGPGYEYCPGWEMGLEGLPRDVVVTVIDEYGNIVFEDNSGLSSRVLRMDRRLPGVRHYILFTDSRGMPFKDTLRLKIDSERM